MATTKVTFTLDEKTVQLIGQVAKQLEKPKSQVVRDALSRLEQALEAPVRSLPAKLPPNTLEAIYAAETEAERRWENRTAEASSLKAEAF